MLELNNIYLTLKEGRPLIKNMSYTLNKGDKTAIIGEEGNGKSTLLKLIYDSTLIDNYCKYKGTINKHNNKIGYLKQSLDIKWNEEPIINYFLKDSPEDIIDYNKYNNFGKLKEILNKFNMPKNILDENYLIKYLSGGEKVKLQITKLLLEENDILLLDEPTNDLDIESLEWLENFINKIDKPIMYVSHDETLLENTANTIIQLEQIKKKSDSRYTIEKTNYKDYIEKRLNKIEFQNKEAQSEQRKFKSDVKILKEIKNKVMLANPGRTNRMDSIISQEKKLKEKKLTEKPDIEEAINMNFNDNIYIPKGKLILDLKSNKLKLYIKGPEHIVIVGKNGIGKTTLIKKIYEELKNRKDITLGYMPQNYEDILDLSKTALDYLKNINYTETDIRKVLGGSKFTSDEMTLQIKDLSGGQQAKLLLIKMILNNSNVLLLDEPTRNLSPLSNPVIRKILRNYKGVIISVSHDRKYIEEVCDKIYLLDNFGLNQINVDKIRRK